MTGKKGNRVCFFCGRPNPKDGPQVWLSKQLAVEGRSKQKGGSSNYLRRQVAGIRNAFGLALRRTDDVQACSKDCPELLRFDQLREERILGHIARIQNDPQFHDPLPGMPEEKLEILWGCA